MQSHKDKIHSACKREDEHRLMSFNRTEWLGSLTPRSPMREPLGRGSEVQCRPNLPKGFLYSTPLWPHGQTHVLTLQWACSPYCAAAPIPEGPPLAGRYVHKCCNPVQEWQLRHSRCSRIGRSAWRVLILHDRHIAACRDQACVATARPERRAW